MESWGQLFRALRPEDRCGIAGSGSIVALLTRHRRRMHRLRLDGDDTCTMDRCILSDCDGIQPLTTWLCVGTAVSRTFYQLYSVRSMI